MADVVTIPTTPEGVLCRAAEVIEQRGWINGDYGTPEGVCVIGACLDAIGVDPLTFEEGGEWPELITGAAERMLDHVQVDMIATEPVCQIVWWNDDSCPSKAAAASVLRAAAGGCGEVPGA